MSYRVELTEAAEGDLLEICEFLESRSPSLPDRFLDEFSRYRSQLEENPQIFRPVKKIYRKLQMKKFKYNVVFSVDDDIEMVRIVAVIHSKRHPRRWKERMI